MKSNTAKGFVAGVLLATMMSSTNVFADAFEKVINIYTGINVYVNDVKLGETNAQGNPNAFIYNGTTYASVNEISKALGQNVIWDGNSRRLYLGKHEGSNYIKKKILLKWRVSTEVTDLCSKVEDTFYLI